MKEKIASLISKQTTLSEKEAHSLIEIPPSPQLGDYSFPCFVLAKTMKKNPNEIASDLSKKIKCKEFEKIESAGPYINFFVDKQSLAQKTLKEIFSQKEKYGSGKGKRLILIESPGPNTNKPLHIGHARNIIIAQSMEHILKYSGNTVKIVNINNDRGVHICKSMIAYEKWGNNSTPEKANKKSDHFVGDWYVKYAQELEKDSSLENEVKSCLSLWENNDKKTLALWKKMNSWAYKGFNETYKKLNFAIDKQYYESEVYKDGKKLIEQQLKKGLVHKKEDGAVYADLSNEGLGEKILLRADGTSIYITQDLYLAVLRKKEFNFDEMLYVVANEQNHHFSVLFSLLKKFGYSWANKLHHLSYGLVHLESGRMKSREGTVVDTDNLLEDLEKLAKKEIELRESSLPEGEKAERAQAIALAALRYYFLKVELARDIVFKPEESIKFEGNTGPYLLYTYARAKSILRKAGKKKKSSKLHILSEKEKALITELSLFPAVAQKAAENLAPNVAANYAHSLAQTFNEWYHAEKVLGSENESNKLSFVEATSLVLKNALALLGIETLEVM